MFFTPQKIWRQPWIFWDPPEERKSQLKENKKTSIYIFFSNSIDDFANIQIHDKLNILLKLEDEASLKGLCVEEGKEVENLGDKAKLKNILLKIFILSLVPSSLPPICHAKSYLCYHFFTLIGYFTPVSKPRIYFHHSTSDWTFNIHISRWIFPIIAVLSGVCYSDLNLSTWWFTFKEVKIVHLRKKSVCNSNTNQEEGWDSKRES